MVLKTREKILLGSAIFIGLVLGFDQFVTRPKKKEIPLLQKQVQEYNEKLALVSVSLTGFKSVAKRVEEKKRQKEALSGRISDDRQLDLLLEQMAKESRLKQINLVQLNIGESLPGSQFEDKGKPAGQPIKKVAVETGLTAGYEALGPYFEALQSLPVFLEMEQLDIRRKDESFPKLEVAVKQALYISSPPREDGQIKDHVGGNLARPFK